MADHLYLIGDAVDFQDPLAGAFGSKSIATYTVKALLPPLGTELQYRIKSTLEPYDRVVREHQLSRRLL